MVEGRIILSPLSALPLETRLVTETPILGKPDGGHLNLTLGGAWKEVVQNKESPLFLLLQVPSSRRASVTWEPEWGGGFPRKLEVSQEVSLCPVADRGELTPWGL